ncbi:MAG: hypothetical protein ACPGII_10195, partial [Opitutales bacterium]
ILKLITFKSDSLEKAGEDNTNDRMKRARIGRMKVICIKPFQTIRAGIVKIEYSRYPNRFDYLSSQHFLK